MAAPSPPTNISFTKLSVNSYSVSWSTLTTEAVTSTIFSFDKYFFLDATLPVTLPTIAGLNTNYKVIISGLKSGNNIITLASINANGLGVSIGLENGLTTFISTIPIYKDYNIISSATLNNLTIQIKSLMSGGWEPLGGVIFRYHHTNLFYMQTMVLLDTFNIIHI